jgi:hypothetical protein
MQPITATLSALSDQIMVVAGGGDLFPERHADASNR